MNKREVILYIAMSLDGFIATTNGDISWLSMVEQPNEDYGYYDFIKTVDTVIMGRKTYEKVLSFGIDFPHKDKKCYVISRSRFGYDSNVEFYQGDLKHLIDQIRYNNGKHIYCDGGSEVVAELMQQNLIDRFIISIVPVILGDGIKLFKNTNYTHELFPTKTKLFSSGLVQIEYVQKLK